MADYPGTEQERRVAPAALAREVRAVFAAAGMDEADADLMARSLVRADQRGVHSHGVMRVKDYVGKLTRGGIDPRGRPRVVRAVGGAVTVDGGNSMGQVGSCFAMRVAIERAREHGIAMAALGNSNHCGALDFYVQMAIEAGVIGICGTDALPTMAPWGGIDKMVGLNPIGVGIPAGEEPAFVFDGAMGATAYGKMRVYKQKGAPIPEGWAFDAEGRPTTDVDQALLGLVQPIGQHKGIGLAMAIGLLSTLLSGAGYGTRAGSIAAGAAPGSVGQFFIAIDIGAFTDPAAFRAQMDDVIREYRSTRLAPGFARVYLPGRLEEEIARRHAALGIPLNAQTLADIEATARHLGLVPTL